MGRLTGELAKTANKVIACDFLEHLTRENEKHNGSMANIDFITDDATKLKLPNGSLDVVFSNWLLMYLSDQETERFVKRALEWVRSFGNSPSVPLHFLFWFAVERGRYFLFSRVLLSFIGRCEERSEPDTLQRCRLLFFYSGQSAHDRCRRKALQIQADRMRQSVLLCENQTQLQSDLLEVYKSAMPEMSCSL